MSSGLYIRPAARIDGQAPVTSPVITIGGRADCAFAAAELIERDETGLLRKTLGAADVVSQAQVGQPRLTPLLARLDAPRPPVAGLTLDRPRIMGVVNVTPDSFSDGGRFLAPSAAIEHALQLAAEGADILDIGGESTRPGADPIAIEEELRRVMPVIEGLRGRTRVPLSIDTRNAEVMRQAAQAGIAMVNDVSALTFDPAGVEMAARIGVPIVLMHAQGDPRTMQRNPTYRDVVLDVYDRLAERIEACERAGIPRARLVVDPGIGFGKTLAHNLTLLGSLSILHGLGCAVLLGASRKSFIGGLTGARADDRLPGSIAAALLAAEQGVQLIRVHDVAATRQALALWQGARRGVPI